MSNGTGTADAGDFSLVLGGPLHRLITPYRPFDPRMRSCSCTAPYYEVALSVRPIDAPEQLKLVESDPFIRWDKQSSVYGVQVNRLNVEIGITVRSDDPDFAQRLNAIFNREITRGLMDTKTAASIKPAVGARVDRAEVIRIATRKAEDTRRDLINYAAPRVSCDPQTKRWTVLFDGIVDPAPGNHFSVFIDDQTAAATLAPGE